MRRKVYRSLDQATSVFGIRGRFLWGMAFGGALAFIIGTVTASLTSTIVGAGAGLVLVLATYFAVLVLQSRLDERDIWKIIIKRAYPTLYTVRPKHIRNLWRGFNLTPLPNGATDRHE